MVSGIYLLSITISCGILDSWGIYVYAYGVGSYSRENGNNRSNSILGCYTINYFSALLGGFFQNFTTISKVILIGVLAIAGFKYGDPKIITNAEMLAAGGALAWLGALAPIAFSYDGWVVSTSISHEIKNSKKNLPIALIIGPNLYW